MTPATTYLRALTIGLLGFFALCALWSGALWLLGMTCPAGRTVVAAFLAIGSAFFAVVATTRAGS